MIKTFCDEVEPIQVELIDSKGNKTLKKGKLLSIKDIKEMDKFYRDKKDDNSDIFDVFCRQVAFVFEGKAEDYEKYSFNTLKNVMEYVREELMNPTSQVQES